MRVVLSMISALFLAFPATSQVLKTNILYDATSSMSLGFEVRTGGRTSLDLPVSYNPWDYGADRHWKHILAQPAFLPLRHVERHHGAPRSAQHRRHLREAETASFLNGEAWDPSSRFSSMLSTAPPASAGGVFCTGGAGITTRRRRVVNCLHCGSRVYCREWQCRCVHNNHPQA